MGCLISTVCEWSGGSTARPSSGGAMVAGGLAWCLASREDSARAIYSLEEGEDE